MDRIFVNYSAHDAGEQFRLEVWEGGTNDTVKLRLGERELEDAAQSVVTYLP